MKKWKKDFKKKQVITLQNFKNPNKIFKQKRRIL